MKLILTFVFALCAISSYSQSIDSTKYSWNLSDIYANHEAWEADLQRFENKQYFSDFESFDKPENLIKFCKQLTIFLEDENKLSAYINIKSDLQIDFDATSYLKRLNQVRGAKFGSMGQIMQLLKKDEIAIRKYLATSSELYPYRQLILSVFEDDNIANEQTEELLDIINSFSSLNEDYDLITQLIRFSKVNLSSGEELQIDWNTDSRMYADRSDRETIYLSKITEKNKYSDLFANLYKRKIGYYSVQAKVQDIDPLTYLLNQQQIPTAYYDTLIQVVNDNLGLHHRYLKLMSRLLGVDTLRSWDIEVIPQVESVPYSINKAMEIIASSLAVYGKEYIEVIHQARDNNWIDIYPKPNGRSRATYVAGVHPFVSVVYDNSYISMRSLGHELGHCIEYSIASKQRPYPTFYLPNLLAEVPSNVNESLINHYLINHSDHAEMHVLLQTLFYLNGSLFSTALNAEVEYELFKKAENPYDLNVSTIQNTYLNTRRKYFGEEEGISKISSMDASRLGDDWFIKDYYQFRWFTYTMGAVIASNIKEGLISGRLSAEDYLNFIKSGDQPTLSILEKLGIDLSTRQAYQPIFDEIKRLLELTESVEK